MQHTLQFTARGNHVLPRRAVAKCDQKHTSVVLYVQTIWSKAVCPGIAPGWAQYQDIRVGSQCSVRYVSVCRRILTQFTHPSIHAIEAGFLQSRRYQLTYDESNFDSRRGGATCVLTDPVDHPTSYPTNNADSSIGERLHEDASFKKPKNRDT